MPTLNERPPDQKKPSTATPRRVDAANLSITGTGKGASSRQNNNKEGMMATNSKPAPLLPTSPTTTAACAGRTTHNMLQPGERELLQAARRYSDREKEKQVKWFPAKGLPIPSEEEIQALAEEKQQQLEQEAAQRREEDRQRRTVEIGHVATVACSAHPLYMDDETKASSRTEADEPQFGVVAATGIGGRQLLQSRFATACFTALLRARAEQRLNKAIQARALQQQSAPAAGNNAIANTSNVNASSMTSPKPTGGASSILGGGAIGLNLTLLTLPSALPTGDTTSASIGGGSSSSSQQQGGGSSATAAAANGASNNNNASSINGGVYEFPEQPSTTNVELFKPKMMHRPLEFKQKDYHHMKFSDHHYANADLPEIVSNFPAGLMEAPEAKAGEEHTVIGTMDHFTQPIVTLETHKAVPFAFSRKDPQSNLILGVEAQPVTDGGFLKPHDPVNHGQEVPSMNEDGDFLGVALFRQQLPAKMKFKSNDDDLSDTDDDEGTELPSMHPKSLILDVADWLPIFSSTQASSSTTAGGEGGLHSSGAHDADQTIGGDGLSLGATIGGKSGKSEVSNAKKGGPVGGGAKGGAVNNKGGASLAENPAAATLRADEEAEQRQQKKEQLHFDALNQNWLGWASKPVHSMANRTANESFVGLRAASNNYVENEVLNAVPKAMRKIL